MNILRSRRGSRFGAVPEARFRSHEALCAPNLDALARRRSPVGRAGRTPAVGAEGFAA